MTATIKIIHESEVRTAKNGRTYKKVVVLTTIDGVEFLDIRYIYEPSLP